MFVYQESPPTVQILGSIFSLLNGSTTEPGGTMRTIGLNTAVREIKQALELARAQNQPQVSIIYPCCHFCDDTILKQYHERIKQTLERVEVEIDVTSIQVNYHLILRQGKNIVLTIWIS